MTYKEYLLASLSKFQVSVADVNLILINQEINGEDVADIRKAKEAIYAEFSGLIPIVEISEGGMSIKWNLPALKMWYSLLAKELGKVDVLAGEPDNEVTDRSYMF